MGYYSIVPNKGTMTWTTRLFALLATIFGDTDSFTLTQVYQTCTGAMTYYYPNNNTVDATIRRTLEDLRDMGIIAFVDNAGTYTWAK